MMRRQERTFILVFHESLYYGERLDHSLINPNQLRAYGISFWDKPLQSSPYVVN